MNDRLFSLLFLKVSMQVFITGATGLIGNQIVHKLLNQSHSITILTRDMDKARRIFGNNINYCNSLSQFRTLNHFDAVINLAGEPIADKRWTKRQKEKLCRSRWKITEQLSQLINESSIPPKVFISGSAVGYYGSQKDNLLTEQSQPHKEFTHYLCQRWEELALSASNPKTRVCLLRTGIVLARNGGALAKMLPAFRLGLGGVIGTGKQFMPWIHIQDMTEAILFLLTTTNLSGAFNLCAPNPVTNEQFSHSLANELRRPCFMPIPSCGIKFAMGEGTTVILNGQRALPDRLQQSGFCFNYDTLEPALNNLLTHSYKLINGHKSHS